MRHEATDRTSREKFSRHAAEDPLAQPGMPIRPGDKQVSAFILCDLEELGCT